MPVRRVSTLAKGLVGVTLGGYAVYVWRVQSRTPPPYVPRVMPRNDDLTKDVPKLRVVYRLFTLLLIMIPVVLTWPLFNRNDRVREKWYRLVKRILVCTFCVPPLPLILIKFRLRKYIFERLWAQEK